MMRMSLIEGSRRNAMIVTPMRMLIESMPGTNVIDTIIISGVGR